MTFIVPSCVSTYYSSSSSSLSPSEFLTLSLSSPFQLKASDHNRSTIHRFLFTSSSYCDRQI
ncbi:hypothetical protein CR513_41163, partial [Mucuna pruriens]